MNCEICGSKTGVIFKARILNKYLIDCYFCEKCRFLRTEKPFWLNESYLESINIYDTGVLERNIALSKITAAILFFLFDKNAKYLDFGGGYGILTRLMRDTGFDFYWQDPYTRNLTAKGFEYNESVKNIRGITCFETFEHFTGPIKELESMLRISKNILFSTELLPGIIPPINRWPYYGFEHGQHVSFYSFKSLECIAKKYGLNLYSTGSIHLFTEQRFNPPVFKMIVKLAGRGLSVFVKKMMKSKTSSDRRDLIIKNKR
ncbi:MAG: class I SAM-dependent methyltransferase [Candidatus Omnitrophota bacterium]